MAELIAMGIILTAVAVRVAWAVYVHLDIRAGFAWLYDTFFAPVGEDNELPPDWRDGNEG